MRYSIMNEGTVREMIAEKMRDHRRLSIFTYRFINYSISYNGEVKEIRVEAEGSVLAFYKCQMDYKEGSSRFRQL